MKRSWFGLGLMAALLVASLLCSQAMVRSHSRVEEELLRSARYAEHGDWEKAEESFRRARKLWEDKAHFRAALADHTPVEEADADFEAAETYCRAQEKVSFPAACRSLARQTAAVGEAHELVWWNIL